MFYATLDEALTDIAGRSFYESATVTPVEGGFTVEDSSDIGEEMIYDHGSGVEWPEDILDHSREHDPAEYYDMAAHVRYNLNDAVGALEAGRAVTFGYVVIDTVCEDGSEGDHEAQVCLECDGHGYTTTGWALVAA